MVSLANDIFGENLATNLFPLIYAGTDAVNGYKEEFEDMGALTEDQVHRLAEFDNVLNRLKTQYVNTGIELGESLLPVMETFSDILTEDILPVLRDAVNWFKSLDENQQKNVVSLLLLTAALSPALRLMSNTASAVSSLWKWMSKLDRATLSTYGTWVLLAASVGSLLSVFSSWDRMNSTQKIIGLLGGLTAAALSAAVAFGVFHSAWSVGLAVAGIVAGIAAATAAVKSAANEIGTDVKLPSESGSSYGSSSANSSDYTNSIYQDVNLPSSAQSSSGSSYTENSTYVDNSTTNISIEKNEYMTEDDIIQAVNRGLREARQSRT